MIRQLKLKESYKVFSFENSRILKFTFEDDVWKKILVNENDFIHNDVGPSEIMQNGLNYWHWKGRYIA